jgi:hypothetical protein
MRPLGSRARHEYAAEPASICWLTGHDFPSSKLTRTVILRRASFDAGLEKTSTVAPALLGCGTAMRLAWQTGSMRVVSNSSGDQVAPPSLLRATARRAARSGRFPSRPQ